MTEGTFLSGCMCDGELRTLNLTLIWVDGDPEKAATCGQAARHGVEGWADPLREFGKPDRPKIRGTVAEELGWCRCGNNEEVDEAMLTFLSWLEERSAFWDAHPHPDPAQFEKVTGLDPLLEMVLAYIATEREWTEHGSIIPGWLTDAGKEVLANLRKPEYAPA